LRRFVVKGALLEAEEETRIIRSIKVERGKTDAAEDAEKRFFDSPDFNVRQNRLRSLAVLGGCCSSLLLSVIYDYKVPVQYSVGLAALIPTFYHRKRNRTLHLDRFKIEIDEGFIPNHAQRAASHNSGCDNFGDRAAENARFQRSDNRKRR